MPSPPFKVWVARSYSGEDSEPRWLPQPPEPRSKRRTVPVFARVHLKGY